MAVWSKLMPALGGGAHEAGGVIVDSQTLRILDQEIRDADTDLRKSKEALADTMDKEKQFSQMQANTASKIQEYEGYAMKALDRGDEALALEVATKIAELETVRTREMGQIHQLVLSATQLQQTIEQAQTRITRLKQQADTIKATESVQRAQATLADRDGAESSRIQTALEAFVRIQQKQAAQAVASVDALVVSAHVVGDEDALDARLRMAGITPGAPNASGILARLKARRDANTPNSDTP